MVGISGHNPAFRALRYIGGYGRYIRTQPSIQGTAIHWRIWSVYPDTTQHLGHCDILVDMVGISGHNPAFRALRYIGGYGWYIRTQPSIQGTAIHWWIWSVYPDTTQHSGHCDTLEDMVGISGHNPAFRPQN